MLRIRAAVMKLLESRKNVRSLAIILLLVIFVCVLLMLALYCEDWWMFFLMAVVMGGALVSRLVAYVMLPVAYIGMFHNGWMFDAYEQFIIPGDVYSKLVALKIAYVHATPLSYWLGVLGELAVLIVCGFICRYLLSLCKRTAVCADA